jgi:hypothetical protein
MNKFNERRANLRFARKLAVSLAFFRQSREPRRVAMLLN